MNYYDVNQYVIVSSSSGYYRLEINQENYLIYTKMGDLPEKDFSEMSSYEVEHFEFNLKIITDRILFESTEGQDGFLIKMVKLKDLGNLEFIK